MPAKLGFLVASLLTLPAAAEVVEVDPRSAANPSTIAEGLQAAGPEDLVVLFPGTYPEDVFVDRPVWLIAQQPGTVTIEGSLVVTGIGARERVVLRDLEVRAPAAVPTEAAVTIVSTVGPVELYDCVAGGNEVAPPTRDLCTLLVEDAERVVAVRCAFVGHSGTLQRNIAGIGARLVDARLAAWDSTFRGGDGTDGVAFFSPVLSDGASALTLERSRLFASGCDVQGGLGGADLEPVIYDGGADGGDGVRLDSASDLQDVGSTVAGGAGGISVDSTPGADGLPIAGPGAVRHWAPFPETHRAGRWAFSGQGYTLELEGRAGRSIALYVTTATPPYVLDHLSVAAPFSGVEVALDSFLTVAGPLGGGTWTETIPIPALPVSPAPLNATIFGRSGHAGRALFGAPMPLSALDCSRAVRDCNSNGIDDLCEIVQGLAPDTDLDGIIDGC